MDYKVLFKDVCGIDNTEFRIPLDVSVNEQHTTFTVINRGQTGGFVLYLKKPVKDLSIFQCEMLYCLVVKKKKPNDYAQYHKCEAGREFFENIEKIEVLAPSRLLVVKATLL